MAAAARPRVAQLDCSKLGGSLAPVLPKTWKNMETALKNKLGICTIISLPNNTAAIPKRSMITKANSVSKNKEIPVNAYI